MFDGVWFGACIYIVGFRIMMYILCFMNARISRETMSEKSEINGEMAHP